MAKDPAFLFYSSDFLVGTNLFSDEQVGKYIRVLCQMHQQGHLTKKKILQIIKNEDPEIMEKFLIDKSGNFYNKKLDNEIKRRVNYCKSRKNNRLGVKHMKNICKSYDSHMETETETINKGINKRKVIKKDKPIRNIMPPKLEWVERYCAERKNNITPQKFMDSNTSKGWMIGKQKMVDWQAAVRTWENSDYNKPKEKGIEQYKILN